MALPGFKELYRNNDNTVKRLVKNLEKTQIKFIKCRNQIEFLKVCRKEDLTPKGMCLSKRMVEPDQKIRNILKNTERSLIKAQLHILYKKIRTLRREDGILQVGVASILKTEEFRWLIEFLEKKMTTVHRKDESRLKGKLDTLRKQTNEKNYIRSPTQANQVNQDNYGGRMGNNVSHNSSEGSELQKHKNESGVVNLTPKLFGDNEIALLQRGTNFAIKEHFKLLDTITQLDGLTKDAETIHRLVDIVDERMEEVSTQKFKNSQLRDVNTIDKLKADKDIRLLKADKGGKLVIMSTEEYRTKMREQINAKYTVLNSDPTRKWVAQLRLFVTSKLGWSSAQRDAVTTLYPKVPVIYGQPKIHKDGNPLRLIISQIETCYSGISKYLTRKLNEVLGKPASHIKNSNHFLEKIKQYDLPNTSTLLSLDVIDMYNNINTNQALAALERKMASVDEKTFEETLRMSKNQCLQLVNMIISNNYFVYEDVIYQQGEGLAMGSSLSPLLSDLVMEELEIGIQEKFESKIAFWVRFYDDTFIEWTGRRDELNTFLTSINEMNNTLKFTMEIEDNDSSLTFLDVRVTKHDTGVHTGVYKKPTAVEGIIPYKSYNPLSLKVSVARQKLRRIETHYTKKTEKERAKRDLRECLVRNEYPNKIIKRIFHCKVKNSSDAQEANPNNNRPNKEGKKFFPLQYDELMETKIPKLFSNDQCGIAWKQKTKTLDLYKKTRLPTKNQKLKNVIYVIPCTCGHMYIGETGRPCHVRLKEHMANVRLRRDSSKLYLHLGDEGEHEILWDAAFIIEIEPNERCRKIKEGILIELNKKSCISDKTVEINKGWDWILHKYKVKRKCYGAELFVIQY